MGDVITISTELSTKGFEAGSRALTRAMRNLTQSAQRMGSSIKRIIPTIIGVGSAYQVLSKAINTYMSQNEELSQRMTSIWTALGNVIGPIIEKIIDWVTSAVSYLLAFLKALGVTSKSASQLSQSAKKNNEELRRTIFGFDELNVLQKQAEDKDNDKGTGLKDVELPDWVKQLVDFFKNKKWDEAADLLIEKLDELIYKFRDKAFELGDSISEYLGGILHTIARVLDETDWHALGEGIAKFFNGLFDDVDGEDLGKILVAKFTIAFKVLTGFLEELDFGEFAEKLSGMIRGAFDAMARAIEEADFEKIGQNIRTFFENIDWEGIRASVSHFLSAALQGGITLASETFGHWIADNYWEGIGASFMSSLTGLLETLGRIAASIPWDQIASALVSFISGAMNTLGSWLDGQNWGNVGAAFTKALTILFESLGQIAGSIPWVQLANALIGFLSGALDEFTKWLESKDFGDLGKNFNEKITNALGSIKIEELTSKLSEALSTALVKLGDWINGADFADLLAKISEFISRAIEGVDTKGILASITYLVVSVVANLPLIILAEIESQFRETAALFRSMGLIPVADMLDGMADRMKDSREDMKEKVVDRIIRGAKEALGVDKQAGTGELGQVGVKAGEDFVEGVSTTITGEYGGSHSSGKFESAGEAAAEKITTGFESKMPEFHSRVKHYGEGAVAIVDEEAEKLKDSGESAVENLETGVDNKMPRFHSRVREAVSETVGTVEVELGKVGEVSEREWEKYSFAANESLQLVTSEAESNTSQLAQTIETNLSGVEQSAQSSFDGVKDTITSATSNIASEGANDTKTLYTDVTGIYNDIHSEAVRIFSDIGRAVPQIMNYLAQEVQSSVQQMEQAFTNMQYTVSGAFDTIRATIESAIYSIESLDWSIPAPHVPHINVWYDTVYSDDGSSYNIPQFDVQWYKRGGIFDKATLIGVGEDGEEAVIPLENNTEWISKLADQFIAALENGKYRLNSNLGALAAMQGIGDTVDYRTPAIARGTVLPYSVISDVGSSSGSSMGDSEILDALREFSGKVDTIISLMDGIEFVAEFDNIRALARRIRKENREAEIAEGSW